MKEPGSAEIPLSNPTDKLVLLVEDDDSLLELMEHVVKQEGFRTECAKDGAEALLKVKASKPHLVVVDLMLPGVGGYEVVRELQAPDFKNIPVIIVTGRRMDRQSVEMIRLEPNVREFMDKPLKPAVLSSAIHSLLKTRPPDASRSGRA